MRFIRLLRLLLPPLLPLLLAACALPLAGPFVFGSLTVPSTVMTPAMESAQQYYDSSQQGSRKTKADAGDPIAEYQLGDAYCCRAGGLLDRMSVYDNERATYWFCRAAHSGYLPAQLRLARIYSGHPIDGLRIMRRISAMLGGVQTDTAVALMWAEVAAADNDPQALALRENVAAYASPAQRERAQTLLADWRQAPCEWVEVFPQSQAVQPPPPPVADPVNTPATR